MNLLVHVEDSRFVGILPSQLSSIRLLGESLGVEDFAFIDKTTDGVFRFHGWKRFGSMEEWQSQVDSPIIIFDPHGDIELQDLEVPEDAWLVFGPSMGFQGDLSKVDMMVTIPIKAVLNSRDAVPIVLWEVSR